MDASQRLTGPQAERALGGLLRLRNQGLQVRRYDLPMVVQDQQAPAERFEQRSDDWTLGKGGDLRLKQFWGGARKWDGHVHRRDVRRIEHAADEYHGPSRPVMTHLRTERSSEWRSCSPSTRSGPKSRKGRQSEHDPLSTFDCRLS